MLVFVVVIGILFGFCDSHILTNEESTDYGVPGVIVNPKSQKLVLKCNYTGEENKEKYEYVWYKDGESLVTGSKYKVKVEGTASTLTVGSTSADDAGNYSCKLNEAEHATLKVLMYPTMEHVERSKNQVQGDPLTILCKVRGFPTPVVTWNKDDRPLELEDRVAFSPIDGVKNAKLVIKDLQYEDKGKYTCQASIMNVTRTVDIIVRVKDKYAALWPFLGICAEVAILCTIIFIFERRRTKPEFEDDDDKKDNSSRK